MTTKKELLKRIEALERLTSDLMESLDALLADKRSENERNASEVRAKTIENPIGRKENMPMGGTRDFKPRHLQHQLGRGVTDEGQR